MNLTINNMRFHNYSKRIALVLSCLFAMAAQAQKLPSIQQNSVYAPANIKVDGKATEWDNKFQAYNNHVEFFYTLANNDDNLYLTVQATQKEIIRRIMTGGITLTINKSGKKNDKDGESITFPLFDSNNRFTPRYTAGSGPQVMGVRTFSSGGGGGGGAIGGGGGARMDIVTSGGPIAISPGAAKPLTSEQADSLMKVNNTNFSAKAKNIGTSGIKDMDSLISVYNMEGIKAVGAFDNKTVFTCELAIPLKYLGIDANSMSKFTYHIQINKTEQKGINIVRSDAGDPSSKIVSMNITSGAQMGQDATDFWGEYTLAKKP